MDHEKNECEKVDEIMLPGFRFHPTDEELVGFYLTRKVQHKPLSIELIKQLDIYKFDPWDLPKLAASGEKEWYFYCPRDRKYRNSTRPNRVTGAGFWKATGTDRPIYSSQGSKCIGLKKSLVFYKGRAAKGIKTDWMMHEFRLPSVSDSVSPKKYFDKNIPANEAWAICRIFKKANSSTQRTLSHSWVSPSFDTSSISDMMNPNISGVDNNIQFSSSTITMANMTNTPLQFGFCNDVEQSSIASFSPSYFPASSQTCEAKCVINDASSLLLEMSTSVFGDLGYIKGSENVDFSSVVQEQCTTTTMPMQGNVDVLGHGEEAVVVLKGQNEEQVNDQCGTVKSMGFPYCFPMHLPDAWKSNLLWPDSPPCPSDQLSTSYSTNKCYT